MNIYLREAGRREGDTERERQKTRKRQKERERKKKRGFHCPKYFSYSPQTNKE